MKRKQIYLDEKDEKILKEYAIRENVSEAYLIREAVAQYITSKSVESKKKRNPLLEMIGLFKDGPSDGSINHDHYIYGVPKKHPKKK